MTSEEKMHAEFEDYFKSTRRIDPMMLSDGSYDSPVQDCCWEFWKASRDSLVIELPTGEQFEPMGISVRIGYDSAIEDCRESIHAAGVKTK